MGGFLGAVGGIVGFIASVISISDWLARRSADHEHADHSQAKYRIWMIDRVRVTAMIVGAAIACLLGDAGAAHAGPLFAVSLSAAVVAVVGLWYGPWAGLFAGAVGYAATAVLNSTGAGYIPFPPAFSVADGIIGLAGGFVCLYRITGRRKLTLGPAIVGALIAAVGVVIGDLVAYGLLQHQHIAPSSAVFSQGLRSDLICTCGLIIAAQFFQPPSSIGASFLRAGASEEATASGP